MIARLRGEVATKSPGEVVVDVGGVGYHAHVSLSTFYRLPEQGETTTLEIVTNLRENALELFGFDSDEEKRLFSMLRAISGIGPRLALAILSGIEPAELVDVLRGGMLERLTTVPGIGRKTAERLMVELKGKLDDFDTGAAATGSTAIESDAVLALVALGYKRAQAHKAVKASRNDDDRKVETLIKRSLALLS